MSKLKKRGKITKYSHFFVLSDLDNYARQAVRLFLRKNLLEKVLVKENGKWTTKDGKYYAVTSADKTELSLHINCYEDFLGSLKQWGMDESSFDIETITLDGYHIQPSDIRVKEEFIARDYQEPLLDYITGDGKRKIINLSMGLGKTFLALKAAELMGCRTAIVMLPKYKEKWIEDMTSYLDDMEGQKGIRYVVLDTVKKLAEFLDTCKQDIMPEVSIVIVTITTLVGYYNSWDESSPEMQAYMVPPHLIWHTMGIGYRITDECHEFFHANYCIDLRTHMPKALYLSATLDPSGKFTDQMYRQFFPVYERMGGDIKKAYINVTAVKYTHEDISKWRYVMQGMYSHTTYETNLLKGKSAHIRREAYFKMINDRLQSEYFDRRREGEGQKAIIFFATVKMCSLFTEWIKKKRPGADVRRYISEDDYEELISAEIAVSTTGSAGTAVDIPGLIYACLTISRRSKQSNLQCIGRLRELRKWEGQYPYFDYLVMGDNPTSWDYHKEKYALFKDVALTHTEYDTGVVLPN